MKVIIAGGTGYIGAEILSQSLSHPNISEVIILSRRELPDATEKYGEKAKVLVIKDFLAYSDEEIAVMAGADACIWAIGTYNGSVPIDIDYPLAFAHAFAKTMYASTNKPFRYVHLGGAFTERDQVKSLWYFQQGRRIRGMAEAKLEEFGQDKAPWETYLCKPAAVVQGKTAWISWFTGRRLSIRMEDLATAMVDVALNGDIMKILLNEYLVNKGQALRSQN